MLAYVTRLGTRKKKSTVFFYGTNSMHTVWESACKQIFGDMLGQEISDLDIVNIEYNELEVEQQNKYNKKLIDIIDKPIWSILGTKNSFAKDTLIPDTVVIKRKNNTLCLNIYDAKYYHIKITDDDINRQPGIESVTKQYLYHKAYKQFMKDFNIEGINNIFLVPTDGETRKFATVSLSLLHEMTGKDIEAAYLNADDVWKAYVDGIKDMDLDEMIYGHTK